MKTEPSEPDIAATTLLNDKQVAVRWNISVKTLRNKRVTGGAVAYIKIGRSVRYRLADVLAYENDNRRQSTSEYGATAYASL